MPAVLLDASPFPQATPFDIADDRTIIDVNVRLDVEHTSMGQLVVNLRHPDGSTVFLANHRGGSGNDFVGTIFDDEASQPIAAGIAPFTGSFRPDSSLSILDGRSADGTWSLEILDNTNGNVATIAGFEIQITLGQACAAGCAEESSARLSDTCGGGGLGSANGAWDDGESAIVRVTLANTGQFDLTGVSARIAPAVAGLAMIDDLASFPDIPRGTSAASSAPDFRAFLAPGFACGAAILFDVTVESDQGTFADSFQVGTSGQGSGASCSIVNCPQTELPFEVIHLDWTDKTTLQWSAGAAASAYALYRGVGADLPALATAAGDSCTRLTTAATSASGLTDAPPPGVLQWWLVRGSNGVGLGPAGLGSSGPRSQDSTGICP